VPELLVTDIGASLSLWRDLYGFAVAFERSEEGFAYLDLDGAQVMLEECGHWAELGDRSAGIAAWSWRQFSGRHPFHRTDPGSARRRPLAAVHAAGAEMIQDRRHRTGVDQFLVQDPDGYLIRFSAAAGERCVDAIAR
jgi:catechol 2,3-dioxygenase-like lactoylglutathione lyase family enzyme